MENTNEVQNEDGKPEIIKNKDDKEFTCDLCEKIFKRRGIYNVMPNSALERLCAQFAVRSFRLRDFLNDTV